MYSNIRVWSHGVGTSEAGIAVTFGEFNSDGDLAQSLCAQTRHHDCLDAEFRTGEAEFLGNLVGAGARPGLYARFFCQIAC
jgi:hypothetical protein